MGCIFKAVEFKTTMIDDTCSKVDLGMCNVTVKGTDVYVWAGDGHGGLKVRQ